MAALKAWGVALCFVAAACAVLEFLAPKNSVGRLLEILCGAVLLFCVLSPLVKVDWSEVLSWEVSQWQTEQSERLQDHLQQQLHQPLQEAVAEAGAAALASYGLTAEKIEGITDIHERDGIYIREIRVHLNAQQAVRRVAVKQILEQRFGVDVTIREV